MSRSFTGVAALDQVFDGFEDAPERYKNLEVDELALFDPETMVHLGVVDNNFRELISAWVFHRAGLMEAAEAHNALHDDPEHTYENFVQFSEEIGTKRKVSEAIEDLINASVRTLYGKKARDADCDATMICQGGIVAGRKEDEKPAFLDLVIAGSGGGSQPPSVGTLAALAALSEISDLADLLDIVGPGRRR